MLVAVGRARKGPERALFEAYASRITGGLSVAEVEEKRPLPVPDRRKREAELLLAQVPPGAAVIALDERGAAWDSVRLSTELDAMRLDARPAAAFLIGGADGHGPAVLERADKKLSLGAMTWPHMLVRGMLAEQLYRAQCISAGHPYHRA